MASIIQSNEIGFHYGRRPIFKDLFFGIEAGDMVALLGANGVGKNKLLNIIAGLLRTDSGAITVDGTNVADWERRELSRFVALVPQTLEIPFSFRVDEVVAQGRVPYLGKFGAMSAHDRDVVEHAMDAVDVKPLRDRVYSELSGGERQRVKIAIGLAQQPRVMLLDEPTQHLDIGRQIEVVSLLKRLNQSGITIFAAIHDLSIVRDNFRNAVLLMNQSCVAGPTGEVMRPSILEDAFRVDATAVRAFCETETATLETEPARECRRPRIERRWRLGRR